MQTFEYKDFLGSAEASIEDGVVHGRILHINGLITYEAETISELKKEFEAAVDDYLQFCKENNIEACKSFNGKFNVRISPELHKQAVILASKQGSSLNAFVTTAIENEINSNKREIPTSYKYMERTFATHIKSALKNSSDQATSIFSQDTSEQYNYASYRYPRN